MGAILSQLGHLFVQSIPTVVFVFLLLVILGRIFFPPLIAVLKQREAMTTGALARAREQTAEAEAKTREYELAFQTARQEVYRQREADRQAGLKEREITLQKTREQADVLVRDAQLDLAAQVEAAKRELAPSSKSMASEIMEAVLGNGPSTDNRGGGRP